MRCERAQEWMVEALEETLAPRRRRALDDHLAACPSCRQEIATTERLFGVLDALLPALRQHFVGTLSQQRLCADDRSTGSRIHGKGGPGPDVGPEDSDHEHGGAIAHGSIVAPDGPARQPPKMPPAAHCAGAKRDCDHALGVFTSLSIH